MIEIERSIVGTREGVPVAIKDIANVKIGGELRRGAASKNGYEVGIGTALMLAGENSRTVAGAVRNKLLEIRNNLPPGIVANIALDRSQLVVATITTVVENLAIGALLVIATLFLMLGNVRAATIATLVIPLSILMSATGMNLMGISGNLMSLSRRAGFRAHHRRRGHHRGKHAQAHCGAAEARRPSADATRTPRRSRAIFT